MAVYNVENLFDRPKAMNLGSWSEGKPVLQDFAALNQLLGEVDYTTARKTRMAELMTRLGWRRTTRPPSSSCAATTANCCDAPRRAASRSSPQAGPTGPDRWS